MIIHLKDFLLFYLFILLFNFITILGCKTSLTNEGDPKKRHGQLNTTCQFPFTVKGKTYYTCTWDYSHTTGQNPWCSVDTDDNNKHHGGKDRIVINGIKKKFWGVCDDTDACNIPPRCKWKSLEKYFLSVSHILLLIASKQNSILSCSTW